MYWNEFYMYKRTKSTNGNNEETKRKEQSLTITRPKGRKTCGFLLEKFIFSELNISADKYEESN